MAGQIRRVLSGAASWAMSLGLALGILIFLICCVTCLSEGDPIWAFGPLAIFPGMGYALRVYLSHVERKERHPALPVVVSAFIILPPVLLARTLIRAFRGEIGGEAPSEPETRAFWVNWI